MLQDKAFPSSQVFDEIVELFDTNETIKNKTVASCKVVLVIKLRNKHGDEKAWFLDLKSDGVVGVGDRLPTGGSPDVTLVLLDEHFSQMVLGTANAQRLFITGKLKIHGDVMKAAMIQDVLHTILRPSPKL